MRVAVDARSAVFPEKTGVGYYTWNLLRQFPRVDPSTRYLAWYLNAKVLLGGSRRLLGGVPGVRERWTPIPARWFDRLERFDIPRLEWLVGFDVLFAPNFVPPPSRARRQVVTVHDLAFRRYPETAPHATRSWLSRIEEALGRASRVIAVSEATRRDLLDLYDVAPERVVVVPHGVDHEVFRRAPKEDVERVKRRFGIDGPYVLYLGGIEPRKNLPNLIEAYARLDPGLRPALVLAGSGVVWNPEGKDSLRGALERLPAEVRPYIVLTGYVQEAEKVAMLSGAEALVYPSRYEGFGLPVLEAMACGTPVVTSNVSALPEVAGDAALLVDPGDPSQIADAIERLLTQDELRSGLRARGLVRAARFTWEETAKRTASLLHEAARD
jgi:glycosyltransferase involved in cell wall biosynthesis